MNPIESYPSIFNLGHRALLPLLSVPLVIEEKVDGSQFSFGKDLEGNLACRSKGKQINMEDPEKLFGKAVESVRSIGDSLIPGFTYRGEYLSKPHHNTLTYGRVPALNVIIYDVQDAAGWFLDRNNKQVLCVGLGLELVPTYYHGKLPEENAEAFLRSFLDRESILGGQKVEGIVLKPAGYDVFGPDKKLVIAKLVSEAFKEVHGATWKTEHGPKSGADILQLLGRQFATPARWQKAIQHLSEGGQIENDPRDIGKLMKEVPEDVLRECKEEILDAVFAWAWPQLKRTLTTGLPEWYKEKLVASAFETVAAGV